MKLFGLLPCLALASGASAAQDGPAPLTLDDALRLARENNGDVRAAFLSYEAAKSDTRVANAAFLPTLTPSVSRTDSQTDVLTGRGRGVTDSVTNTAQIQADWLLLDNGRRRLNVRRSQFNREGAELSALQSLRQTLFGVHQRYYNALRAQELLKVQRAQVERTRKILEQTEFRYEVGAGPRKDILQARADLLNAQANELMARNGVATSEAELKAIIGWGQDALPVLAAPEAVVPQFADYSLAEAITMGLARRADLQAQRRRIDSQEQGVRISSLATAVNYQVGANFTRMSGDSPFNRSQLTLTASFPLFDGGAARESLRSAEFGVEASRNSLTQSEREARAEIESAYPEFAQNRERFHASQLALEAARLNFEAALAGDQEGAGTLIEVLTAQVTLATAESNFVQAFYDTLTSEVRLRLVTGQGLPGEAEEPATEEGR